MNSKPVVFLLGSDSDCPAVEKGLALLDELGVGYDVRVMSAHRTPEKVREFAAGAAGAGHRVIVAVAGLAAHLAGVVASLTTLPVIGVPVGGGPLNGLDALLSTVQMPPGVPVGTVSIGSAGGVNAAVLACRILALSDEALRARLIEHTRKMAESVEKKDAAVQGKRAQGT